MNRRNFIGSLSVIGTALIAGCRIPRTTVNIPVELKVIEAGSVFSLKEIETDSRFITEYDLGVSLNKYKFFRFREHNQTWDNWRAGVIVDDAKEWRPYYIQPTPVNKWSLNWKYILEACDTDIDAEVHAIQTNLQHSSHSSKV